MGNPKVSVAGDYAVLEVGELYFYYGYEHVWCRLHEKFADNQCCSTEDSETEWAFTVKQKGKYIAKFRRSAEIDEFNVEEQMIYGLGKFTEQREKEKAERDDRKRRNQFSSADIS